MTAKRIYRLYSYSLNLEFITYVTFLASFFYSIEPNNFYFIYLSLVFYSIAKLTNLFQEKQLLKENHAFNRPMSELNIFYEFPFIFIVVIIYLFDLFIVNELKSEVHPFITLTDTAFSLIHLLIFLIITNHLSVNFNSFFSRLFILMSFIVSLNAFYYLENYWVNLTSLTAHSLPRLGLDMKTIGLSPGDYPPTFGLIYAIFCAPCFILALKMKNSFIKSFLIFETIILFSAILLTQTREDIIALFIALTFYYVINTQISFIARLKIISSSLIFLISILIYVGFTRANFDGWRVELITKFIDHALQHPLLGYGQQPFKIIISSGEAIGHGHNLLLNAELRGGIVAFSCMVIIIFYGLYRGYKLFKLSGNAIPFVIILILMIAGMVDYDAVIPNHKSWQWIGIWFPICLITGADSLCRICERKNET